MIPIDHGRDPIDHGREESLTCTQITWGSCYNADPDSVGLGAVLGGCISVKIPDVFGVAGPWTTL